MQRVEDPKAKFIIFDSDVEDRLITVIDGQPYFRSIGQTFPSTKGMWFPFIMYKGNIKPRTNELLTTPPHLNAINLNILLYRPDHRDFIIGYNKYTSNYTDIDIGQVNKSISSEISVELVLKKHLITTLRLSHAVIGKTIRDRVKETARLNSEEQALIDTPIKLADEPEKIVSSTDDVNLWLLQNGATDLCALIKLNENLSDIVARYAAKDLFQLCQSFAPAYTNNLFNPRNDPVCNEACEALENLARLTHSFAKLQIQTDCPVQDVIDTAGAVCKNTKEFVQAQIGGKLDASKKDALIKFCAESVNQLSRKRKDRDQDPDTQERPRQRRGTT